MSPIIFHNLFDDDESDQETESVREVAIPVLYSVEELFNMMADFNTAAAVLDDDDEDTEEIIKMEEDLAKTDNIENNKPAKKLTFRYYHSMQSRVLKKLTQVPS